LSPNNLPEDLRSIPAFTDTEAIIAMFLDEDMREWSVDWPRPERALTPREAWINAIEKAKSGSAADLIDLAEQEVLAPKKKRGKPRGSKKSDADRVDENPVHRAASMVPTAELILRSWYPSQRREHIRELACLVVAEMWHHRIPESIRPKEMNPTADKLINHLARSKRHRIV
jgi:hypothetical protein